VFCVSDLEEYTCRFHKIQSYVYRCGVKIHCLYLAPNACTVLENRQLLNALILLLESEYTNERYLIVITATFNKITLIPVFTLRKQMHIKEVVKYRLLFP
jgi:hypothetical protein